jgi:hypothetical protein
MRTLVLCALLTACSSPAEPSQTVDPDTGTPVEEDTAVEGEDTSTPAEDSATPDTGTKPDTKTSVDTFVPEEDTYVPPADTSVKDTAPVDTGPPACNAVTPGYYVTLDARRENRPPMTFTGGTIPDGTYELKTYVEYNGPSGLGTYAAGGKTGEAIKVTGTTWERSFRPVGGYPNKYENYTAELTGTDWKLTKSCGTSTSYTPKYLNKYSVTTTGFILFQGTDTTGSVSTYVKK